MMKSLSSLFVSKNILLRNILQKDAKYLSSVRNIDIDKLKNPKRSALQNGPGLKEFLTQTSPSLPSSVTLLEENIPYLNKADVLNVKRKVYFEIYGCQMNVNDTEIVWAILKRNGFLKTDSIEDADVVLIITCAIRESAESKIWTRLQILRTMKRHRMQKPLKIGILGCMAERLKTKLIEKEKAVDLVAGPDSYKDLPRLLALTENNQTAVNVLLSLDETYADITPIRINENSKSAFVSIMRGCDNMCTYCIVPFTRGRERSRPVNSILDEVKHLSEQGVKEIVLLGQNVNSYRDLSVIDGSKEPTKVAKGFRSVYKTKLGGMRFADLLDKVSLVDPEMRIRFTSPHPKDFPDEVLQIIKERSNICKSLHLPAQSGNNNVLERMRRGHTRESYLELVQVVKSYLPSVCLSSDFICGFCSETDEEFEDTVALMEEVKYNTAFIFKYSMREKTTAHRRFQDDVPDNIKSKRCVVLNDVYRKNTLILHEALIESVQLVLVEGKSKKQSEELMGRNDGNIVVIFPDSEIPASYDSNSLRKITPGDYIAVKINDATASVLKGTPLFHTTLCDFNNFDFNQNKLKIKSVV